MNNIIITVAAIAAKSMRADVPIETIATTTVASLSFYHNNTGRGKGKLYSFS